MSAIDPAGRVMAALLERSISYALGCVNEVTPRDLANPTPCTRWDLRALLWHTCDSLSTLIEGAGYGRIRLDIPADGVDPLLEFRVRAAAALGAWSGPGSRPAIAIGDAALPSAVVAGAGAVEIAVHGWDIAQSCHASRPIPEALAHDLLELCPLLTASAGRTPMFAPAVPVPDTLTAGDRLVALLGRRPLQRYP